MRTIPVNAFRIAHQKYAQFIHPFLDFITHEAFDRLFLPVFACQFMNGKNRVIAGMVGKVNGRAINHFAVFPNGQIIGNGNGFGMGDEETVVGAFHRCPASDLCGCAGLVEIDGLTSE